MPGRLADGADLDPYLAATPPRQILARVLRNLKSVYMKAGDADRSLAVANRMLALLPDALEELRDRGTIYAHMGAFRAALEDLQSYLRRRPDAPDATDVRARVVELAAACARLN
jgi:regulator of sirC expression with transglutaminase-like and TPR domain